MITVPASPPAVPAKWSDLADELDRWAQEGRTATLWWRDDDAAAPSRRLDDLLATAGSMPVALAVIPALAQPALAGWLRQLPAVWVLQHGWLHANRTVTGKKSEFPASRAKAEVTADLVEGRSRLKALFGGRALAVLAPPWNHFGDGLLPLLAANALGAISRVKPRPTAWPATGVYEANVHVDLVAWRGDRGFVGEPAALSGLVGHLRARRTGLADADEPTGILTHHLVQDRATGDFLGRLLALTRAHRAARWLDAAEVFAPALGIPATADPA
jgi:hypothetical protein